MNFLLYCCFSDRFRSTFSSSFVFLSKYCAQFIGPNWNITDDNKNSVSLDNMSYNSPQTQSSYSLRRPTLNNRISNMSNDLSQKCLRKTRSDSSQRYSQTSNQKRQSFTEFSSKFKSNKNDKIRFKDTLVWQSSEKV
jgi:hypothetical protein